MPVFVQNKIKNLNINQTFFFPQKSKVINNLNIIFGKLLGKKNFVNQIWRAIHFSKINKMFFYNNEEDNCEGLAG